MPDAYMGPLAYPFYQAIGFTKGEIAAVSHVYGMIATISGGFIGGLLVVRYKIFKALMICGILQAVSNLMFVWLAYAGNNIYILMATISADNVIGGMATTAFVAYLSSLCNKAYTATQYALLSSLMSFARDIIASTSGVMQQATGWPVFFLITVAMGIPGLLLLHFLGKKGIHKITEGVREDVHKPDGKTHRKRKSD
jgi:PAT family beta-lactamase induction signal transducer AmpG